MYVAERYKRERIVCFHDNTFIIRLYFATE